MGVGVRGAGRAAAGRKGSGDGDIPSGHTRIDGEHNTEPTLARRA